MATLLRLAIAGVLLVAGSAAAESALKTEDDKTIYALGLSMSRAVTTLGLSEAELEILQQGLRDGALGKEPKVDLQAYGPKIQELAQQRLTAVGASEQKEAASFLEKAAKGKGVKKTASGILYKEEKAGSGETPTAESKVKVHYHGTLRDGSMFDSSVERGEPVTFPLGNVIPCWTEGLQTMKVGGKTRFWCPAKLAYGDRGAPPKIKPGAALVFDVELLGIEK
jgi:FKBP-type peptidyl-prolyl cis-trans isomerase FkpA